MSENIPPERSLQDRIAFHNEAISYLKSQILYSARYNSPVDIGELQESLLEHEAKLEKLLRQCPDDGTIDVPPARNEASDPTAGVAVAELAGSTPGGETRLPKTSPAREEAMAILRKTLDL
jgi:hypothetical protein